MSKQFKWTIEVSVDEIWVADGFDFDQDRLLDMLDHLLPFAHSHERSAEVLQRPDPKEILQAQGY